VECKGFNSIETKPNFGMASFFPLSILHRTMNHANYFAREGEANNAVENLLCIVLRISGSKRNLIELIITTTSSSIHTFISSNSWIQLPLLCQFRQIHALQYKKCTHLISRERRCIKRTTYVFFQRVTFLLLLTQTKGWKPAR
jgi:hypothetical protein